MHIRMQERTLAGQSLRVTLSWLTLHTTGENCPLLNSKIFSYETFTFPQVVQTLFPTQHFNGIRIFPSNLM